jgi:hypothetical protein
MFVSLSDEVRVPSRVLIGAVRQARETIEGLQVSVFGFGVRAESLRRRLEKLGLDAGGSAGSTVCTVARWNATIKESAVVGVTSGLLCDDATAYLAWIGGRPVIRIRTDNSRGLARAICDAILSTARRESDVAAGAALASREVEPSAVAAAWMRIYLEALSGSLGHSATMPPMPNLRRRETPLRFPELRSRLSLTALGAREALASWILRPDDWKAALEWLGSEAVRAVLTIRVFDVTDLNFDGTNAHMSWDVDLNFGENHRAINVRIDGRSLAGRLGLRTQWGYFHPIAHARLCHLPREGLAPQRAPRRLRCLSGRKRP